MNNSRQDVVRSDGNACERKIIDGPFNDFNGVIEEVSDEKKKLKVQVKIFGRATPVELSYMQVEKLA